MAGEQDDNVSAQSAQINTSQPTPLRGLALKSAKAVPMVSCEKPGGDGRIIKVNKADYDEEIHGPIVTEKIPTRKKKAKKKTAKKEEG